MTGRIVVTGAESTGKTTLARALARQLNKPLLPEQLRLWVDAAGKLPNEADLASVAIQHIAADERLVGRSNDLAVLDTDLATIAIYWRHYFARTPAWVLREVAARKPLLYLIADTDVPWEADPQRDGPETRLVLQRKFLTWIPTLAPAVVVSGSVADRVTQALQAIRHHCP